MGTPIKSRFKPSHPEKYIGDVNNIICRSSWERHFCNWCDNRDNVLRWASEEVAIKYYWNGKVRNYYPDYLVEFIDTDGSIKKQIVEVKPKKQCSKPEVPKRITKSFLYEAAMWEQNQAKWRAATEFALDNGITFRVITEDELGIKQYDSRRTRSNGVQRRRKSNRKSHR